MQNSTEQIVKMCNILWLMCYTEIQRIDVERNAGHNALSNEEIYTVYKAESYHHTRVLLQICDIYLLIVDSRYEE
jgi:hypothetical protein